MDGFLAYISSKQVVLFTNAFFHVEGFKIHQFYDDDDVFRHFFISTIDGMKSIRFQSNRIYILPYTIYNTTY